MKIEALADDGVVVPGQPVKVNVIVANRGAGDVAIKKVKFDGFDGDADVRDDGVHRRRLRVSRRRPRPRRRTRPPAQPMSSVRKDQVAHCEPTLTVPADARVSEPYWHRKGEEGRYTFDADAPFGLPMRPTPFYVQVTLALPGGEEVIQGLPVQHRYEGDIFSGEKRTELLVVPALSVRVTPQVAIVPAASIRSAPAGAGTAAARHDGRGADGRGGSTAGANRPAARVRRADAEREIRVTVVNDTTGAAETSVKLELPQGWSATPAEQPVKFARSGRIADRALRREAGVQRRRPASITCSAIVRRRTARRSTAAIEVIEYPHITRYHIYDDAPTRR